MKELLCLAHPSGRLRPCDAYFEAHSARLGDLETPVPQSWNGYGMNI